MSQPLLPGQVHLSEAEGMGEQRHDACYWCVLRHDCDQQKAVIDQSLPLRSDHRLGTQAGHDQLQATSHSSCCKCGGCLGAPRRRCTNQLCSADSAVCSVEVSAARESLQSRFPRWYQR